MAKMYVFRKLSKLNQQQTDVRKEAISSVLDDVLKGKTSTIISYGTEGNGPKDMVECILNELFKHVYTMGANMEINISMQHRQLFGKKRELKEDKWKLMQPFVASTKEVHAYMRMINHKSSSDHLNKQILFTICVQQANLEGSLQLQGKLQLIHFKDIYQASEQKTPINGLLKILNVLASNSKTHLRYYNTGLSPLLKDLLGSIDGTVIFNCKTITDGKVEKEPTSVGAKVWQSLYIKKRLKCKMLNKKILSLKRSNSGLMLKLNKNNHKHVQLLEELIKIKEDATVNFKEMLDLQQIMPQLQIHFDRLAQQLEQKNQMLSQQHELLLKANEKVQSQRISFQQKLTLYADMFSSLWQQQRYALQLQEQKREVQLSKIFESIYSEWQQEQLESSKVKSG